MYTHTRVHWPLDSVTLIGVNLFLSGLRFSTKKDNRGPSFTGLTQGGKFYWLSFSLANLERTMPQNYLCLWSEKQQGLVNVSGSFVKWRGDRLVRATGIGLTPNPDRRAGINGILTPKVDLSLPSLHPAQYSRPDTKQLGNIGHLNKPFANPQVIFSPFRVQWFKLLPLVSVN